MGVVFVINQPNHSSGGGECVCMCVCVCVCVGDCEVLLTNIL